MTFEPDIVLEQITTATARLLETAAAFTDEDVRRPSLLPGWSRGHVLTHVARNADGGTRMLTWARTGVPTPEYASMEARAQEIEAGHGRGAGELLDDVRTSAARFAEAYRAMPAEAWTRTLRWTSGRERPAARAADSRLTEVLIHHVDLRADYRPHDWPPEFAGAMLATVVSAFAGRADAPAVRLTDTDSGAGYLIGDADGARVIRGARTSLLAWLLGRSDGAELGAGLPRPPFLY
jgi:maleylpyruvate isomerase